MFMKKRNPFLIILFFAVLLSTACNHFGQRSKTVKINNENEKIKIEYCGEIYFNDSETSIEEMSPNSYVKYYKDGKKFKVESDDFGKITYKFYNNNLDKTEIINEIAEYYK